MNKMKRGLSFFLAFSLILTFSAFIGCSDDDDDDNSGSGMFTPDTDAPAANSIYMELESTDNNNFVIAVKAKDLTNVYGIYFDITYNGDIVGFVSAEEGNFINKGSNSFFFATGKANSVVVGVTRQGQAASTSGSGTICKITFYGKAAGTSRLDFQRNAVIDPNNNAVPGVTWSGGTATIVL